MKKLNFLILFLLAGTASFAQTWSLDKAHSNLGFSVSHLMVSEVDGSFMLKSLLQKKILQML
jgi:polyisoprenoid-binding protein YceI